MGVYHHKHHSTLTNPNDQSYGFGLLETVPDSAADTAPPPVPQSPSTVKTGNQLPTESCIILFSDHFTFGEFSCVLPTCPLPCSPSPPYPWAVSWLFIHFPIWTATRREVLLALHLGLEHWHEGMNTGEAAPSEQRGSPWQRGSQLPAGSRQPRQLQAGFVITQLKQNPPPGLLLLSSEKAHI